MQDPQPIWEFGRWIARRVPGSARLSWTGGEVVLGIRDGRIHSADGLDANELSERLGCKSAGQADLLAEARALAQLHGIAETRAMGTAKEMLQRAIHEWLMDSDRQLHLDESEPPVAAGATISITHAVVELVLADTEHNVADQILPERAVVLQRSRSFIELYAPLRLSEEADLIVASITGATTADSIARESSHHPQEVHRLVAALVATGVLEPSEPEIPAGDLSWPDTDFVEEEQDRRKIPLWLIGAVAAAVVVALVIAAWLVFGGNGADRSGDPMVVGSGDWGVVVEMGCEPQDLQRMLKKRNAERKALRTIPADPASGENCFRLVWGSFPNRAAAEEAIVDVPAGLVEDGFQAHVIEVTEPEAGAEPGVEDGA
jgi:hypothetical protein